VHVSCSDWLWVGENCLLLSYSIQEISRHRTTVDSVSKLRYDLLKSDLYLSWVTGPLLQQDLLDQTQLQFKVVPTNVCQRGAPECIWPYDFSSFLIEHVFCVHGQSLIDCRTSSSSKRALIFRCCRFSKGQFWTPFFLVSSQINLLMFALDFFCVKQGDKSEIFSASHLLLVHVCRYLIPSFYAFLCGIHVFCLLHVREIKINRRPVSIVAFLRSQRVRCEIAEICNTLRTMILGKKLRQCWNRVSRYVIFSKGLGELSWVVALEVLSREGCWAGWSTSPLVSRSFCSSGAQYM
jgi:hypothetical protein